MLELQNKEQVGMLPRGHRTRRRPNSSCLRRLPAYKRPLHGNFQISCRKCLGGVAIAMQKTLESSSVCFF